MICLGVQKRKTSPLSAMRLKSTYALIMISEATYHGSEDKRLHVIGVGGHLKYNMRRLPYLFRSYLESFPSKRYIDSGPTPYGEET
jgi:hypothetical protein